MSNEAQELQHQINTITDPRRLPELLIKLANVTVRYDALQGEASARQALRIALTMHDNYWIARANMALGGCLMDRSNYSAAYRYFKQAWSYLRDLPEYSNEKSEVCRHLGLLLAQHRGDTYNSLRLYQLALEYSNSSGDNRTRAINLCFTGEAYYNMNSLRRSLEYLEECLHLLSEHPYPLLQAHAEYLVGSIYRQWQEWDLSLKRLTNSLNISRDNKGVFREASALRGLGELMFARGKDSQKREYINQSLDLFYQSESLFGEMGHHLLQTVLQTEIGEVYTYQKNYELAFEHYQKGLALAESIGNPVACRMVKVSKANTLIAMEDWQEAIRLLEELEPDLDGVHLGMESDVHSNLARAYEATNNIAGALLHYKKFIQLERKTVRIAVHRKLMEIEVNNAADSTRQKNGQANLPEQEKSAHVNTRDVLSDELEQRKKMLETLRSRLLDLEKQPKQKTGLVGELIRSIDERNQSINGWGLFEQHLSRLDSSGPQRIRTQYPSLTESEMRIATLLLLNLSNKEISSLLNVSPRTVDTHRTSIRKKMKVSRTTSLVTFLAAL